MPKFKDPNPEWPVPVRTIVNGELITAYAHNPKELDKFTNPVDDPQKPGLGYTTSPLLVEWPKCMSHPREGMPDILVQNEEQQARAESRGYNFDHWENKQRKNQPAEAGNFFPQQAAEIEALRQENADLKADIAEIKEALGVGTGKKARK